MPKEVTDIVPINPPEHTSIELWNNMHRQCSLLAEFSEGQDEKELVNQTNGTHPSELQRIKEATQP
jgi:hypothetical protein